jgi:hypothetical protein
MSGARKHMERSHAGMDKNYSQFRRTMKISGNRVSQKRIRAAVLERLLNVFGRGDFGRG